MSVPPLVGLVVNLARRGDLGWAGAARLAAVTSVVVPTLDDQDVVAVDDLVDEPVLVGQRLRRRGVRDGSRGPRAAARGPSS